jgi:CBS domain-containing protein
LRRKVIAEGLDVNRPVADIMSTPLYTISANSLIVEALMTMMQERVKHLAVMDVKGKVLGVLTNRDLLNAQEQSPLFLIRRISSAEKIEDILDKHKQLPRLIKGLIKSRAKPRNVTRMITAISEAILEKIIDFSLQEAGEPPAKWAFMILGSEGRKEQTLKTDQDNAIVYEDVGKGQDTRVRAYFLNLGERVCNLLDKAGYAFCKGGVMAMNPQWCIPYSEWKDQFSKWIFTAEPEALLHSSIFFDFRGIYGDLELIDNLRDFLAETLDGWSGFFRHLAENALYFKPPIGFFRNFVVESKGEHRNKFDIKSAMMPIVDFARIYALKHGISETNTLERLFLLRQKEVLTKKDYTEMNQAYSFLMQLRFARQITAVLEEHTDPDNYINPDSLSPLEQTMLKEIFKRLEQFQGKLRFDFVG